MLLWDSRVQINSCIQLFHFDRSRWWWSSTLKSTDHLKKYNYAVTLKWWTKRKAALHLVWVDPDELIFSELIWGQKWPFTLTDSGDGYRKDCEAVMTTVALGTWDRQQTGSKWTKTMSTKMQMNLKPSDFHSLGWTNVVMANIVVLWFPEDESLLLEWPSYFWSGETRPKF